MFHYRPHFKNLEGGAIPGFKTPVQLPVAGTIAKNAKSRYVQIINFPGVEKTASLEDIFAYNTNQLLKAFR